MERPKIGIIGSGLIGRAWCMLFTSVGYPVMLYDKIPEQITTARREIKKELERLQAAGILRGALTASEQFQCVTTTNDLSELVRNASFLQECIPEVIDWKRELYKELDDIVETETIISSSTSTFMPSLFSEHMPKRRQNVLVSHPLNPPYYIPLVEIVPAPWTKPEFVARTRDLMLEIGQKPVTLTREIQGFATNRIQYAILNEVWRLVADDVLTVADVDAVMTHGLGLRYAFLGPFETANLNADGFEDYVKRYGGELWTVSQTFGETPKMQSHPETVQKISKQCNECFVPIEHLAKRREARDKFLIALNELKQTMK